MLKTILSVSGKPGLFKLISNGKNIVIVESLADKRRLPIYARDKVVSLGDIAMYTDEDEVPLKDVLTTVFKKENGVKSSIDPNSKPEELRKYFAEILPNYDRDRVYDADIKKLLKWYNLLIDSGLSFLEDEVVPEEEILTEEVLEEKTPKPETKSKKETTPKKEPAAKKKTSTEKGSKK